MAKIPTNASRFRDLAHRTFVEPPSRKGLSDLAHLPRVFLNQACAREDGKASQVIEQIFLSEASKEEPSQFAKRASIKLPPRRPIVRAKGGLRESWRACKTIESIQRSSADSAVIRDQRLERFTKRALVRDSKVSFEGAHGIILPSYYGQGGEEQSGAQGLMIVDQPLDRPSNTPDDLVRLGRIRQAGAKLDDFSPA